MYLEEFTVGKSIPPKPREDVAIYRGLIKYYDRKPQKMLVEDLATLEKITEDTILEEIEQRIKKGSCYSFIGDVLLAVNANDTTIESPSVSFNHFIVIFIRFTYNFFSRPILNTNVNPDLIILLIFLR